MLKSLRVRENFFEIAMWVVTLVFAGFLIGLGGKVVGELPGVDQSVSIESFIPPESRNALRANRAPVLATQNELRARRETASLALTAAENASRTGQESFSAWVATRTATTNAAQDPELLKRTRELDALKAAERSAQSAVEQIDAQLNVASQVIDSLANVETQLNEAAQPAYDRKKFEKELSVFLIRLFMTAPLLVIAGWLVAKQRKSEYWPLGRGFVLFALFAFFFELVPYLPSYGGYVRYGVGVVLTAVAGVYVIRAMRVYIEKRKVVEQQSESERRRTMGYEEAIKKMNSAVCPGCERPIVGGLQSPSTFCVHCGLNLFDNCTACNTRKNAFFQYCPVCGVPAAAREHSNDSTTASRGATAAAAG